MSALRVGGSGARQPCGHRRRQHGVRLSPCGFPSLPGTPTPFLAAVVVPDPVLCSLSQQSCHLLLEIAPLRQKCQLWLPQVTATPWRLSPCGVATVVPFWCLQGMLVCLHFCFSVSGAHRCRLSDGRPVGRGHPGISDTHETLQT